MANLERTCWRGMQIDHPGDWELAVASGIDETPRCTFADRYHHRLDVSWQPIKYVPDLDLVLQRYKKKKEKDDDEAVTDLASAPRAWQGVVKRVSPGTVVHAVRFLKSARWLVDVAVLWPKSRRVELENAILESITAEDPNTPTRLWQAMGVSLKLGREFDLVRSRGKVGRINWQFKTGGKRGRKLNVERLAIPEYWLKDPLREWVAEQMPDGHKMVRQDFTMINAHRGESILSRRRVSPLASLRGVAEFRRAVAWLCPTEQRVYHASISAVSRDQEISLPQDLTVRCCRQPPEVK